MHFFNEPPKQANQTIFRTEDFKHIEVTKEFVKVRITDNPDFEELELNRPKIPQDQLEVIIEALRKARKVVALTFWSNKLGTKGAKALAQLVNSRNDVQKLTLANNELTPDSINQMATVLNNSSLTELKLNDNLLGDAAIPHIIKIIRQNPKLTSLTLSNNLFTKEGFMTLLPALCSHRVLKDVDLSVQQFNFESFSPDDINKIKFLISHFGDNLSLTFSFAEAAYEFKDILEIIVRRANDPDNENRRLGI